MTTENAERNTALVAQYSREISQELKDPKVMGALIATTFKKLTPQSVQQACLEGMMRGFTFKDFLEKNVYAVPFGTGYSLVTSIDFCRKRAMRAGLVGKKAPEFTMNGTQIESCTVTVQRKVDGYVGDFTATVFFDEYNNGRDNWKTKPRTMIAKVAEMHALRMACPEELAQSYVEEEFDSERDMPNRITEAVDLSKGLMMGNFQKNENKKTEEVKNVPSAPEGDEGEIDIEAAWDSIGNG